MFENLPQVEHRQAEKNDGPTAADICNHAEVSDLAGHELVWERDTASNHPRGSLASARASYLMMRHDHMGAPSLY